MHAVPAAMATALTDAGGTVHIGVEVSEVLRRTDGAVAGVATSDGTRIAADAVVCTVDLPVVYDRLLPASAPRGWSGAGRYSPSAVVWHVGVRGTPGPEVGHHNIHFGHEWDTAFEALIDRGEPMPDPSRLVTVPTVTDPTAAPEGCSSALRARAGAAHRLRSRLGRECGPMRERLHAFLERERLPDRRRRGAPRHPGRLGGPGHAPRHPVRPRPHLRPVRAVPPVQRRPARAGPRLRRLRHHARASASRWSSSAASSPPSGCSSTPGAPSRPRGPPPGCPGERPAGRRAPRPPGTRRCAEVTREHGTTYYWGARLLPREDRRHVFAVYTLARLADDIVDLAGPRAGPETAAALDEFEARFHEAVAAGHVRRPGPRRRRRHGARATHPATSASPGSSARCAPT